MIYHDFCAYSLMMMFSVGNTWVFVLNQVGFCVLKQEPLLRNLGQMRYFFTERHSRYGVEALQHYSCAVWATASTQMS